MLKYVSLHNHSEYSLLDGMIKVNDLVDKTLKLNQPASCITDHGNLYTIVDHFKRAEKMGQKAIAGFEAYIVNNHNIKGKIDGIDESESKRNHFLLLAKNNNGYKKLNRICSLGYTEGFYYRPRIDNGILEQFLDDNEDDVIGTSACLAGIIPQYILHDDLENAEKVIKYYNELFHGNFWLEMQPTEMYEQFKVNQGLIELSKKLSIPLVITTDAHYLNKEDKATHDVLLCLQSKDVMSNPNRWKFPGNSYYVMSRDEVIQSFKKVIHYKLVKTRYVKKNKEPKESYVYIYDYDVRYQNPKDTVSGFIEEIDSGVLDFNTFDENTIINAVDETENIANMCNVHFNFGTHYLPKIPIPSTKQFKAWEHKFAQNGKENENYLKFLCYKGLFNKKLTSKKYTDRVDYELNIINEMDFPDYFLIYEDLVKFCHENNIPIGPGRGCESDKNLVKTNHGMKHINEVCVGDKVFCHDEQLHDVIETHQYDIEEQVVTLETEDNKQIIEMTLDHKVYAILQKDFDNGCRTPSWYAINDLQEGDYVCEL